MVLLTVPRGDRRATQRPVDGLCLPVRDKYPVGGRPPTFEQPTTDIVLITSPSEGRTCGTGDNKFQRNTVRETRCHCVVLLVRDHQQGTCPTFPDSTVLL